MAAIDETCQVSIRTADQEADVVLPTHIPIGELMPAVVDLIGTDQSSGRAPHLTRVCGERLDPAATLAQYAIPDGELLILTTDVRPAPITRFDSSAVVEDEIAAMPPAALRITRRVGGWCTLGWASTVLLVLLGRPLLDSGASRHPVIGALTALLMLAGATVAQRAEPKRSAVSISVLAAVFAGLTAALTIPGRPGMPAFMLAMAAMAAIALLACRLLDCAASVLLPVAATAMAATAATMGAVIGWWSTTAVGPMLVAASVAILTVSARLAVRSSGLTTTGPTDGHLKALARAAHHRLTVIVVATAWTAALGAVLTAATADNPGAAAALIAILAGLLLIRAVRDRDPYRVAAHSFSFGIAVTALAVLCSVEAPQCIPWLCGALLTIVAGTAWLARREPAGFSPAMHRAVSTLDLILGAAIVPASCAATGAFAGLAQIGLPW
ncbi:EsaB/YukD family protein [Mycolicibacterium sp.]|uniref:EsaB/YukD family protein n=1 Tax=Mycolicibacterium sp. TaxID=2320850 RepID=UPI0037C61FA1